MADLARPSPVKNFGAFLVCLALCAAAGMIGSAATLPEIPGWYASLEKPPFNPPNWIFGPVWTFLYILMAFSLWRVWRAGPNAPGRRRAIGLFLAQLVLNALWSVVFFGLHSPAGGLVVIVLLIGTLVLTMRAFWPIDRTAAHLLVPYLAWVAFASLLNASILWLNGP